MKKAILSLSLLCMSSTTFFSCKKDNVTGSKMTTQNNENFKKTLEEINAKYAVKNASLMHMTDAEKSARTAATAVADLIGAGDGGMVGAILGPIAAGFGAGLGGVTASYAMYQSLTHGMSVPDATDLGDRVANHTGSYGVANPFSNPYEGVGIRHNQLMQTLCAKLSDPTNNPVTLVFDSTDLDSLELDYIANDANHTFDAYENLITYPIIDAHAYLDQVIPDVTNSTVNDILNTFLTGFMACANPTTAIPLVNDYENAIMSNTALSTDDKQILLQSMAVAKHSYALWYDGMSY